MVERVNVFATLTDSLKKVVNVSHSALLTNSLCKMDHALIVMMHAMDAVAQALQDANNVHQVTVLSTVRHANDVSIPHV